MLFTDYLKLLNVVVENIVRLPSSGVRSPNSANKNGLIPRTFECVSSPKVKKHRSIKQQQLLKTTTTAGRKFSACI
tara:strand:- start:1875 stop:2102 length:228 start_codon:yes stop_codon:yes gene_type:complete